MLEYITGRPIEALCADLTSFVPRRPLDDEAAILLRLDGGAKGTLVCSRVACGEENNLWIRVYGTKAELKSHLQDPNTLIVNPAGEFWRLLRKGAGYVSNAASAAVRTPGGHPESYLEVLANLYRAFMAAIHRVAAGQLPRGGNANVEEGLRGMMFIARAVESSQRGLAWLEMQRMQRRPNGRSWLLFGG